MIRKRIVFCFFAGLMVFYVFARAQEASNNIKTLLSTDGKVMYGNEPNSVVVIDYPENIQRVADYLAVMDVSPQQVIIEARVVEVKLQKEHSLGINWSAFASGKDGAGLDLHRALGITRLKLFGSTANSALSQSIDYKNTYYPPGQTVIGSETPFTLTIFDDNINVVLKALANSLKTDILSAPSVTTVNNREAEIKVIQNLPWAEPSVQVSDSGTVTVTWEVNFEEVGISLKATPTINDDGRISMTLAPEISEKVADYNLNVTQGTTSVPYTVPIIDRRSASTKVVIGNGQTLIIGGLIKDKVIEGETKVPILGNIPLLGYFFKSVKRSKDKTELLIFVSPTIVTPEEFVKMKREERYGLGKTFAEDKDRQNKMALEIESQSKAKSNKVSLDLSLFEAEQNLLLKKRRKVDSALSAQEKKVLPAEVKKSPAAR